MSDHYRQWSQTCLGRNPTVLHAWGIWPWASYLFPHMKNGDNTYLGEFERIKWGMLVICEQSIHKLRQHPWQAYITETSIFQCLNWTPLDILQIIPRVFFWSRRVIAWYGCNQRRGDIVLGRKSQDVVRSTANFVLILALLPLSQFLWSSHSTSLVFLIDEIRIWAFGQILKFPKYESIHSHVSWRSCQPKPSSCQILFLPPDYCVTKKMKFANNP